LNFGDRRVPGGALWSLVWLAGTALALIVGGKLLVLG